MGVRANLARWCTQKKVALLRINMLRSSGAWKNLKISSCVCHFKLKLIKSLNGHICLRSQLQEEKFVFDSFPPWQQFAL